MEQVDNEVLQTQIDVWLRGLERDEAELFQRLESDHVDFDDIAEFSQAVTKNMTKTSCQHLYFSIQRHLSLLPKSSFERLKFLTVIDKLIQQLALQKDGINFDPSVAISNLDLTQFNVNINANSNEFELKYQKQLEKTKWLQKELDQINGGKKTVITGASIHTQDNIAGLPRPPNTMGEPQQLIMASTGLSAPCIILLIQLHCLYSQLFRKYRCPDQWPGLVFYF